MPSAVEISDQDGPGSDGATTDYYQRDRADRASIETSDGANCPEGDRENSGAKK